MPPARGCFIKCVVPDMIVGAVIERQIHYATPKLIPLRRVQDLGGPMQRRPFLLGLLVGCAVTAVAALVARSIETPSPPPTPPTQLVLASPTPALSDRTDELKLPPGSVKQHFNGVPYYIVPLEPAAR